MICFAVGVYILQLFAPAIGVLDIVSSAAAKELKRIFSIEYFL